ncbi:MAG: DUF1573 domain-containing protein [Planctomycetota bacterium]|nr:MAG: DUF1573 domain-containing protein [Planctomycetota bacterium]
MRPTRHGLSLFAPTLLIGALVAAAPARPAAAQDAPASPPPVRVEPGDHVDLGTLDHLETKPAEVRLVNTGDKPLRFSRAMGSCSCIKGTVTTEPVAPGEAATVKLTMQGIITKGVQHKELYVFADGYPVPVKIAVEARINEETPPPAAVAVEPAQVDLGWIAPETPTETIVRLVNRGEPGETPVQFARVSVTCSCVKAELLDTLAGPGQAARLKLTVTAKDIGPLSQKVVVWPMGAARPIEIPVKADVSHAVKADPFFINLVAPPAGQTEIPRSGSITLESRDGRPFRVLSAGGTAPTLATGDADEPALKHTVLWDFTETPDDDIEPWWLIVTDHPGARVLDIRVLTPLIVQSMVQNQGPWTLGPDRIVVGSLAPGGVYEREILLHQVRNKNVQGVSVDSPLLSAEITGVKRSSNGYTGTLRLTASGEARGLIRTVLRVTMDGVEQTSYLFVRID